jgi:imidazolonepropionase-like amidohydrolase
VVHALHRDVPGRPGLTVARRLGLTGRETRLKLCGPRNPYPGDLGVVKEGAYADLLVTEGNPLEDLTEVTNRDHLKIIMKDGQICKNTL